MDYEKKYKEALERARIACKDEDKHLQATLKRILPELKESEDERIRKDLIQWFDYFPDTIWNGHNKKDIIAWLEKQGEQKVSYTTIVETGNGGINTLVTRELPTDGYDDEQEPADKVKPKFKVGDWVLYSGDHYEGVRHITKIDENGYYIERNGLPHGIIPFNHEICMRLWIIQDAKDGDVLYAGGSHCYFKEYIFMFSSFTEDNVISTHFGYDVFHGTFDKDITRFGREEDFTFVTPATKKQRDALFKAMADAGYIFDFGKKELKKTEQMPAWSEEDEDYITDLIKYFSQNERLKNTKKDIVIWLKSLKERVQPQLRWKPRVANR